MRRALQQEQIGAFDHAPRRRKDQDPVRRLISGHRLAAESQFRPRLRCVQAFHHVGTTTIPCSYVNHLLTQIYSNPDVWNDVTFSNQVIKDELKSYISQKLTPAPTKVRADVEVTCFGYDGIDAVKDALRAAEAKNTPDTQIKVKLVSPPLYVLTCQTLDKNLGIKLLEEAIQRIEKKIKAANGALLVKMAPKAVTEHDDAKLQELMDKRERENMQVSGDESQSESDEGVPE